MTIARSIFKTRICAARRPNGFALMDAVIGGVLLAIGMVAILSVGGQALMLQRRGELDVRAASAMDELLSMILTEGPVDFEDLHPTTGRFEYDSPYDGFEYDSVISQGGAGIPAHIRLNLKHDTGRSYSIETRIAEKRGDEPDPVREPSEPIDREARLAEKQAAREGTEDAAP